MKQNVGVRRFTIKLTASTDAQALQERLHQVRGVSELEVQIDASFIRVSPILPSQNRQVATRTTIRSPWQYKVVEVLGRGLTEMRKLTIQGPYSSSTPLTLLTKLLQAHGDNSVRQSRLTHLNLKSIRFYGRSCDNEEFLALFQEFCCPWLEELRISSVKFGCDVDAAVLQGGFSRLRLLAVSGTDTTSLCQLLCTPSIRSLFSSTTLQKVVLFALIVDDEDTSCILEKLQYNTSIREASLGITCTTRGGSALAEMLRNNSTIQKLWLRVRSLEDETSNRRIAEAVRTASSLQELGLYGEGRVSAKSQDYFVDALRADNIYLKELELQGSEECEQLNNLIFLNQLGRQELLRSSNDRQLWVDALIKARHHHSCLFFLIHANPTLCSWSPA